MSHFIEASMFSNNMWLKYHRCTKQCKYTVIQIWLLHHIYVLWCYIFNVGYSLWMCMTFRVVHSTIQLQLNLRQTSLATGITLTHWGRDKMAAICRRNFLLSTWIRIIEGFFNCNFIRMCSQGSNWQKASIGSDNGCCRPGDKPLSVPV